jgi:uncharacterized membrane protein
MNLRATQILQLLLIAVSFILIAAFWNQIPDYVPIRFNVQGTPIAFAHKSWGIFILPATSLFIYSIVQAIPYIDPKKKVLEYRNVMNLFSLVLVIFLIGLFILILLGILENASNSCFSFILPYIFLMFLLMGNFMGKLRPNYFVGIRNPWTLENEIVWIKTHRFAGRLWVTASLIMLALWFFVNEDVRKISFYIYIALIAFTPTLYSFLLFRKIKNTQNSSEDQT